MIKRLVLGGKEIVLVGTAHISSESIKLVEETIEAEKPDVIGVELDKERLAQLLSGKKWQQTNLVEIVTMFGPQVPEGGDVPKGSRSRRPLGMWRASWFAPGM